jgi:hypothetical protein
MKKWFLALFLGLALLIAGCVSVSEEILCSSRWRMDQTESPAYEKDELESLSVMRGRIAFTFAPDHRFSQWMEAEELISGTWELKGKKMILTDGAREFQYPEYEVLELTAERLKLQSTDDQGRPVIVTYLPVPK